MFLAWKEAFLQQRGRHYTFTRDPKDMLAQGYTACAPRLFDPLLKFVRFARP